jgi:hypothetical protein
MAQHVNIVASSGLNNQGGEQRASQRRDLRACLQEFAESHIFINQRWYSPLDIKMLEERYQQELEHKREVSERIRKLQGAIESNGGITQGIYDDQELGYILRSLVRDATDSRWWGSGFKHLCEAEDRRGDHADAIIHKRYSIGTHKNVNIFSDLNRHQEEGTLFHVEYDSDNKARMIKVFHQGHRNQLQVESISSDKLLEFIDRQATEAATPPMAPPRFSLSEAEYLSSIEDFNREFTSQQIAAGLLDNEGTSPDLAIILLNKRPQELAQDLLSRKLVRDLCDGSLAPEILCTSPKSSDQETECWLVLHPVRADLEDPSKVCECSLEDGTHTALLVAFDPANVLEVVVSYMTSQQHVPERT